ncbi:MAG: DUF3187 family protein [Gammaproteobacteria bacterium]
MSSIRRMLGIAVAACVASPVLAQEAEPLHIRNLNPLVSIFGLPAWDTVLPGNRFETTFEVANHYRISARGTDRLILDGETNRTTLSFAHGFDGGWSLGAELPYYHVSGGFLDNAIDAWHSAFRLPDGGRNLRPDDQLRFQIARNGTDFFVLDHARSGIGDVQLKFAKAIGDERQFVMEITAKLATGDPTMLSGSGSSDVTITLLRSQSLPTRKRPAGYYWGVGMVLAGKPEGIGFQSNRWVPVGILGGSWRPWPKFGLKAQLDVHGAFFDTPLPEFGETASLFTFGAWHPFKRRGTLDFAIIEDIRVGTAPDFGIQVAAKWHW